MWIFLGFQAVKMASVLGQGRGLYPEATLCVPPSLWHKSENGACSDDVPTVDADKLLIRAHGGPEEDSVPPRAVQFGSEPLWHEPEDFLSTFA